MPLKRTIGYTKQRMNGDKKRMTGGKNATERNKKNEEKREIEWEGIRNKKWEKIRFICVYQKKTLNLHAELWNKGGSKGKVLWIGDPLKGEEIWKQNRITSYEHALLSSKKVSCSFKNKQRNRQ